MVAIGADHAGYQLKEAIKKHLHDNGIEFLDCGTNSTESVDYPEYGYKTARLVADGKCNKGILCCGTGIGISLAANKVKGIRAAVVSDEYCAEMTRRHNDANIIALGGRVIDEAKAIKLVDIFLNTPFEGGKHQKRVDLISEIENGKEL